jgi:hypothetical protein
MTISARHHLRISGTVSLVLAVITLVMVLPPMVRAQQPDDRTTGTTYILAFPDTTRNTFDDRYPNRMDDKILVYIYSAVDSNTITVTGDEYDRVLTANAGRFTILDLTDATNPAPTPIVTESGRPTKKGTFRIASTHPVVVYCYMVTKFGCAAFTPIPVEFWGTRHYAQTLRAEIIDNVSRGGEFNYIRKRQMAPAEIVVVAADDNTLITLTPSSQSRFLDNPQLNSVRLNRDEAYQVQSYVDTSDGADPNAQSDLGGVYITSSKPVGVISGNTRGKFREDTTKLSKNSFRDMTMEWVAPVEQHGRQFVYMSTMDNRRPTGTPGENVDEKRTGEIVRVYATSSATGGTFSNPVNGNTTPFSISNTGGVHEQWLGVPEAVVFNTDDPAQAFMNTTAVVKFLGTTGWGGSGAGYIGYKYDGWGTYAVEMVPREQWISSAPFVAPVHPPNMEHYLNIVTDTASARKIYWGTAGSTPTNPMLLNKPIPGTDLVWGTMAVNPGLDLFITGWDAKTSRQDTNVRFYAYVYGLYKGHEEYRPGRTERKDDGGDGIASGGRGNEILHPSEYEEYLAVTYGYPLAPSRVTLGTSDSLRYETSQGCDTMNVAVTLPNSNAAGLRSIRLDAATNATISFVQPLLGTAQFNVFPIDQMMDAGGVVVITDRTNRTWRIPYNYKAEALSPEPAGPVDFGEIQEGVAVDTTIELTNPLTVPVVITTMGWVMDNPEFQIVSPPALPLTIGPGQSISVRVRITPTESNRESRDWLHIMLNCREYRIQMWANVFQPVFSISSELDFGLLRLTQRDTLQLRICNDGIGTISFDPMADPVIVSDKMFRVPPESRVELKKFVLGPGECTSVPAIFLGSDKPGVYTAQAIVRSRAGADTVNLKATVIDFPLGVESGAATGTGLAHIDPNPVYAQARIEFTLGAAGHAMLEIFDISGRRVATLVDGEIQQGVHSAVWDASHMPAGTYYCRLTVGEWSTTQVLIVR